MKRNHRRGGVINWIVVLVCVLLVCAVIWGIVTGINKVMHYSQQATIQEDPILEHDAQEAEQTVPPVEEDLPKNSYSTDGFYETDGIRYYHGGDYVGVAGVDVSQYQSEIDWQQVRQAGISFAFIRVGYRGYVSGELDLDTAFRSHLDGALAAGLDVGVYFFSQALTPEEAREEAEYVLEQIKDDPITYPIVFDWEEVQAQARTDEMNMLMLSSCADAFCRTIEEAGYEAAVYFNQAYGYQQFNLVSLKDYQFWLAEYNAAPSFVYDFQFWQYTNEGEVPGIDGPVDLNIAFQRKQG